MQGHKDGGQSLLSSTIKDDESSTHGGDFVKLLKIWVKAGDFQSENYSKNTSSKASYKSKTIQDEFIE